MYISPKITLAPVEVLALIAADLEQDLTDALGRRAPVSEILAVTGRLAVYHAAIDAVKTKEATCL